MYPLVWIAIALGVFPVSPATAKLLFCWIFFYPTTMISFCLYCFTIDWFEADFPVIVALQILQIVSSYLVVIARAFSLVRYYRRWRVLGALCAQKKNKCLIYPRIITPLGLFSIATLISFAIFNTKMFSRATRLIFALFLITSFIISMTFCTIVEILSRKMNHSTVKLASCRTVQDVEQCLKSHFAVCSFTQLICRVDGGPNVFLTLSVLVSFTSNVYMAQITMQLGIISTAVWYTLLGLFALFNLICVCGVCHIFTRKAEHFNDELFKLMRESKELCENKKLQLYVKMKHAVNFTSCGFFTLGYPLVTSIIAAATTYLVILIQFSLLEKSN